MTDNTPSTSALVPFSFTYKNQPLRVEQDADGEPLFHVGDLCTILGHSNPSQAIRQHVDECDLTKREVTSDSGNSKARVTQLANFVREPGMWALILGSHAENAKPVKRWVTAEVLPSIRKTGSYAMPGAESTYIKVPVAKYVDLLEAKIAYLERAAAYQSDVVAPKTAQTPAIDHEKPRHDVLRLLEKAGSDGLSKRDLRKGSRRFATLSLEDQEALLLQIEREGLAVAGVLQRSTKPKHVWMAPEFADKGEGKFTLQAFEKQGC